MNKPGNDQSFGILFQDQMDPDRRIQILNNNGSGSTVEVKVYFRDTGYAGRAHIPRSLLNLSERDLHRNDHGGYGFEPVRIEFNEVKARRNEYEHGTDEETLAEMNRMDLESIHRPRGRR